MRKLIHSSFELDLSTFKISDTEENSWFSDVFFTKYTFPFDIDLEDDLDKAFGFISQYNTNPKTYYEVKYVHNNKIEDAIFEIESHEAKLSCTLRFGIEQLPSFEKKLSELPLDKFDLPSGTSIFHHAESVIMKGFPLVNYNFPQIHVDKYNPEEAQWNGFQKIINNRKDGAFLENTVDTVEDITYNRNVMQPMPYWIHILQKGMEYSGLTLAGEIMNDSRLKKACLFGDVDYFKKPTYQEEITIMQMSEDAVKAVGNKVQMFYNKTTLVSPGKYNISGTINSLRWSNYSCRFSIKYRNTVLFSQRSHYTDMFHGTTWRDYSVDVSFETVADANPHEIVIEGVVDYSTDKVIIDLGIYLIRINDTSGVPVPSIINENKIDCTKAVPNITFGDFVKVVKNWFNYDLYVSGKTAIMNPIENEINYRDPVDLQFTETKKPYRKFQQGTSFLLKFEEIDNKEFKYLPVYQDREQILNANYVENDKTIPIEINALPLPLFTRENIQTAYALESNDSKVYLVHYDGLVNGNNYAQTEEPYLLPSVHLAYWRKWFDFRINAHSFKWTFKAWEEQVLGLKAKAKSYAYNRYHIIKTINRTEIKPKLYEIEIESEGLE